MFCAASRIQAHALRVTPRRNRKLAATPLGRANWLLAPSEVQQEHQLRPTHRASAAAVNAQGGTGAQKAVAVAARLTPQVEALLKQLGINNPTVQQVEAVANAVTNGLVGILNSLPVPTGLQNAPAA